MTDYYGENGMYDAFNDMIRRRQMSNLSESVDRTRDKITVIPVPDPTGEPEQINPISGRASRVDKGTFEASPFKPRGSNTSGDGSTSGKDVPLFMSIRENRAGDYEVTDDFTRLANTFEPNGDANANAAGVSPDDRYEVIHSSVTGQDYVKRPIKGIF